MIQKTKNARKKSKINLIVTASTLAFLIVFYIVMNALIGATAGSGTGSGSGNKLEILEGESYYGNNRIAYPNFGESAIQSMVVSYHDEDGTRQKFMMSRPEKSASFIF